ncbi:MAG TPA: hypothetical protein VGI48_11070 [Caldimonas sp.]|jgi:hypothetical protein
MRSKLRRAYLASAWMLAALVLAGCGPGVGGTGTGAALAAFGASAAPVCGGDVATVLVCPSAPAAPPPASGTLQVQFADVAGQLVLELNGNLAQFDDSCLKLHFSGEFGTVAGGAQGFFGSYELDSNGVDVLAALSTVPAAGGALTIELKNVAGQTVVAPVLLQRLTVPLTAPAPC